MPRETFSIRVEILNRRKEETAIATAAAYLAYADTTDTIGYAPSFRSVTVDSISSGPVAVNFIIAVDIVGDEHKYTFMEEIGSLSRVEHIKSLKKDTVSTGEY